MDYQALIRYLRESCLIDDPELGTDTQFLEMTDEDLQDMLMIADSKVSTSLPHLKGENKAYALVLYSKQDVYSRLSLKYAIQFNIEGEAGKLEKSNRFTHFSTLLKMAKDEWNDYFREQKAQQDVSNTSNYSDLAQGQIFINNRYFSNRNITYHNNPVVVANAETIKTTSVDLSWQVKRINHFKEYKLYISESPIYDKFENVIVGKLIDTIRDFHRNAYRIKDLKPETTYYLAVVIEELNGLKGIHELVVTTEVE